MKQKRTRPDAASAPVPPVSPAPRSLRDYVWLFPCLLALVAFSNSFSVGFPLDNRELILFDTRIRQMTLENLQLILRHSYYWPNGEAGIYHPLTTFSYLVNYTIFGNGENPAGYHWINLLIHLTNVLLVYSLARRMGKYALYIAGLWAVHPVLTEAVTNIIGRSDLLAGTAVLGGLLCYLKSREGKMWLVGVALAAAAGTASKESAVVLPGVIMLWEVAFGTWNGSPALQGVLACAVPVGLVLLQRAAVLAASVPAEFPFIDNPITGADFVTGRLTALAVLGRYLKLAFFPLQLSADYAWSQIPLASGGDWPYWLAVGTAMALTALACA